MLFDLLDGNEAQFVQGLAHLICDDGHDHGSGLGRGIVELQVTGSAGGRLRGYRIGGRSGCGGGGVVNLGQRLMLLGNGLFLHRDEAAAHNGDNRHQQDETEENNGVAQQGDYRGIRDSQVSGQSTG